MRVNAHSVLGASIVRRQEEQQRLESVREVNFVYQNLNIIKESLIVVMTLSLRAIKGSSRPLFIGEKTNKAELWKLNQVKGYVDLDERRKVEYSEKNLSEQSGGPTPRTDDVEAGIESRPHRWLEVALLAEPLLIQLIPYFCVTTIFKS